MIVGFFIGYFIGGIVGIFIYSTIVIASRCDDENS